MFDLWIKGGRIIDGTGADAFVGDIGVRDGKLKLFPGGAKDLAAAKVIDATGKYICPGFIDVHSHADLFYGQMPHSLGKSGQGITTEVAGQCGTSKFPTATDPERYQRQVEHNYGLKSLGPEVTSSYKGFREYIINTPKTTHIKQLAPHGMIRDAVIGTENRPATPEELEQMKQILREALENGAAGMSTGLIYLPGVYAPKEEVVELCKVVAEYDGIYTTHLRDEGDGVIEAVREALDTAREAGCRLAISHHKAAGYKNWGKIETTLAMIDEAIAAGQPVALDVYPFTASMTSLYIMLPKEEFSYPLEERVKRLQDPQIREALKETMKSGQVPRFEQLKSLEDVLLITCAKTPELCGKSIAQLGREWGVDPIDALFDVLAKNEFAVSAAFFTMCEEDLCRVFCHERAMLCTDGLIYSATEPTHPRGFCSYPQAISYFVKEKQIMSLEQAIYKMTALPAAWYRMENKGQIRDGYDADLVIFDYETIAPGFTYGERVKPCPGIEVVLVDGIVTYENGALTGNHPGRLLE